MLAVVIPYYKSAFFKETLDSLANQTDKRFKVYIGDDASPESPIHLLDQFKGQFDFEYQRFDENLGSISLTKQWERCIALTGDEHWLMILGDDDFISKNYITSFYKHIEKVDELNINVIHFAVCRYYDDHTLTKHYSHPELENATDNFFRKYFGTSHGSLTEQIFKKKAYLKYGFRDLPLAWGSDDLAWLDFSEFGKIYGINEATAYFRMSSENISRAGYKGELKKETKNRLFQLLVENDLKKFNKPQRLQLLEHHERLMYRYNKVTFGFFLKLSVNFAHEMAFVELFRAGRKYLGHIGRLSAS